MEVSQECKTYAVDIDVYKSTKAKHAWLSDSISIFPSPTQLLAPFNNYCVSEAETKGLAVAHTKFGSRIAIFSAKKHSLPWFLKTPFPAGNYSDLK
ncbi:hypothetical protein CDAR_620901 [Caerostris darwini]|uniref:Uncharacterized protein n=1 Tax=Caerostris darwini TaxID=1538125 RepID=A0AAV4URS3_9ARAC|nr:hypothetical protein CDAR_620901 [Caerostris darwini]